MSELMNTRENRTSFRWRLLTTVSALALLGAIYDAGEAKAADDDSDHPTVWIELGGQLSQMDNGQETFAPSVMAARPSMFSPSQKFEKLPLYSIDETGKISFEPSGSDWVFSASIRYGHSSSKKNVNQQTHPQSAHFYYTISGVQHTRPFASNVPRAARFADTSVQNSEHHLILDFQAGKDVGLGMFSGRDGSSILGLGVRFAQFSGNSNIALKSDPDWHRQYKYVNKYSLGIRHEKLTTAQPYHSNAASIRAARSFHGIGPSISWNTSTPFAGNSKDGEFLFDWGANAAFLFGRQKAIIHHQSTAQYQDGRKISMAAHPRTTLYRHSTNPPARSRFVTVPNVGGFAGLTFRVENFKMSAGYRADLFFGAMDGGIDTAKSENRGFYGPFASVSVGLGG
jgi:iron complex outermembrane receptor protein